MKKIFAVLAIAGAMTACNNDASSDKTGNDSIKPVDSPAVTAPAPTVNADSLRIADSIRIADSLKKAKK
jgi:hypothetical protein